MSDFPPTLLHLWPTGMAKAFRYHGRREWETAVRPRLIVADFVLSCLEKGRVTVGYPFVASIVAARSSLEIARFAIVDLVIAAADLSAVADSVVPVVVVVAAVVVGFVADLAAIADFVDSAFVVYPSVAVMVKATAAVVAAASCSSGRRSSSSRNRNCPSPLCFEVRASGSAANDRAHWSNRSAFRRHSSVLRRAGRACCQGCNGSCSASRCRAKAKPD